MYKSFGHQVSRPAHHRIKCDLLVLSVPRPFTEKHAIRRAVTDAHAYACACFIM